MNTKNLAFASLVAVLFTVGCQSRPPLEIEKWREVPGPADSAEATAAAVAAMGIKGKPEIHWYGVLDQDEDCGGASWHSPETGNCLGGDERYGIILVAYVGEPRAVDTCCLAHELGHMYSEERYDGDGDPNHDRIDEIWGSHGVVEIGSEAMGAVEQH